MSRVIEIVVSPNGKSRVETKGFTGKACQLASQFLQRALGSQVGEQLKTEFYSETSESHRQHESQ